MSNCGCGHPTGSGPYAEGRALVEFVCQAHGGGLRNAPIPNGGIDTTCQGCGAAFRLETFVGKCPACGGVHAIAPPRSNDPSAVQFAGVDFNLAG